MRIVAKQAGASTNYPVSFSETHDTAHFSLPSFSGPSSVSLGNGTDYSLVGGTIYSFNVNTFAPNGNIKSVSDGVTGAWSYNYDDMNRLVSGSSSGGVCSGASLSWTYDPYGNRWNQSGSGSCYPTTFGSMTFNGLKNRIDGGSYDLSGNLLSDGVHSYTYDAEGRIATVSDISEEYVYDAEGQRVAKRTTGGTLLASYVLDLEGNQVTELNGSGNWVHSNIFAGGLAATYNSDGTRFHLSDWLGTRRVQAAANGKAGLNCFSYPFGDGLTCSGSDADATEHHFTGKERDAETGLDNFGRRYFGSNMGRFMSPDPMGIMKQKLLDPQQWNMYSYTRNNPLRFTDPTGMYTEACSDSVKKCSKKFDEFEKQRQKDLKSKDIKVRNAAAAWGDRGKDNGVHVTIKTQAEVDADAGNTDTAHFRTDAIVTPGANGSQPNINAEFSQDLRGSDLQRTISHEGSHLEDDINFIKSFDPATGRYNPALNPTHFSTEFQAFEAGASVKSYSMFPRGPKGYQQLEDYIYRVYPNADDIVFPPSMFPQ